MRALIDRTTRLGWDVVAGLTGWRALAGGLAEIAGNNVGLDSDSDTSEEDSSDEEQEAQAGLEPICCVM